MIAPYRSPASLPPARAPHAEPNGDADLMVPFALLFMVSAARVAASLVGSEGFDSEPTIALLILVGTGIVLVRAFWQAVRRRRVAASANR